jgi:cation/acetate symporter
MVLLVLVAFFPGLLATPLGPGRVTTIAWPIGAAVIVIPWLLTIVYVRRANADSVAMGNIVRKVLA